ncbi:MAG: twin-arginine translocase subunit TatC [Candidatus Omnitrophica bacterium]|nr:twin-arginine translocase subunit TatC [Candidatus Omnitrophota bacterium]
MEKRLTFLEHLEELRRRIIIVLIFFILNSTICFFFSPHILKILKLPAESLIERLVYFSPLETILIYMRIAIMGGVVLSLPVILYHLWAFISPALQEKYKKYAWQFVIFSCSLFLLGIGFGYFIFLPYILRFLLNLGKDVLQPLISGSAYLFFASSILLSCGFIFQLPGVIIILNKLGLVNYQFLRRKRRWIILFIFILSAIVTPTTDIFSLLVFALPLFILYEISIILARFLR